MDEFLAGLGKWLGTAQFGTAGDWVGGVIAAVALLVAINTQRQQSNQSARSKAVLLRSDAVIEVRGVGSHPDNVYVTLRNYADGAFRDVVVFCSVPGTKVAFGEPGYPRTIRAEGTEGIRVRAAPDRPVQVRYEQIDPGDTVEIHFLVVNVSESPPMVAFTDPSGKRWVKKIQNGRLKRADRDNS